MDFLRKILLIAIISIFVWNTEGMQHQALPLAAPVVGTNVLDFDTIANVGTNIPAMFQPKIYEPAGYNAVGPNNLRYVYFIVFNPGEVEDGNFQHAAVRNPFQADNNIFFPMDGHQPTTPEAVQYSCANIDNRENSPITEWYMQMFGVIPFQNTGNPEENYIKAGWDADANNAKMIIVFHNSCDNALKRLFAQNFRKIASTSVGRVLLYRILIEIRRHEAGNNTGKLGSDIPQPVININTRNKNRSIEIRQREPYGFFEYSARINVVPSTPSRTTVIGKKYDLYSYIATDPSNHDIDIFHEMNHWYHQLRYPVRQINETNLKLTQLNNLKIYRDYWGIIQGIDAEVTLSMSPWRKETNDNIAGEEIRNILGAQRDNVYVEGDDLSENLYRACLCKPLRFGHDKDAFYEDNRVIDIAIRVTATNIIGYSINVENPLYRNQKTFDKGYRPPYNKKGLGNSYYKR